MKRKIFKWLFPTMSILFWIGVWWVVAALFAKPLLLPTPVATIAALGKLALTKAFYTSILTSLARILLGILLALLGGTLLAFLTVKSKFFHHLFSPILTFFKATPVAAIIFLLLLWLGRDNVPLFIAFMMGLPIVWSNVREGLLQTDKGLLEMALVFRVPRRRVLTSITLPSLVPYFLAAARSAISLAWKAGIAAEVLCRPKLTIGGQIYDSKEELLTDELFAWTFVVVIISMLVEWLALFLLKRAQNRKTAANGTGKEGAN